MNASLASRLVRSWVTLYTRGLPRELGAARIEEIESDLWSQHQEAIAIRQSAVSIGLEILARLVLGIAADLSWRLEQGRLADQRIERHASMAIRLVAMLAIIGGLGFTCGVAWWVVTLSGNPTFTTRDLIMGEIDGSVILLISGLATVALGLSVGGLGVVLLNRFDAPIGLVAVMSGIAGSITVFGAPFALLFIPLGSVVAVLYLARIHVVPWSLAMIHSASAPGLVLGLAAYRDNSVVGMAAILTLIYSLTWVTVGLECLRGLPETQKVGSAAG